MINQGYFSVYCRDVVSPPVRASRVPAGRGAWGTRDAAVRVRVAGRASLLRQVVPRPARVLPVFTRREAQRQDLPIFGDQCRRKYKH